MLSICTCRLRKHWRQPWRHAFPLFAVLRCKDLILYCILLYCIAWYCSEVTCFTFLQLWDPKMWYCNTSRFVLPPQHDVVWAAPGLIANTKSNLNPIQNVCRYRSNNLISAQFTNLSYRWKSGWLDFNDPSLEMLILKFTSFVSNEDTSWRLDLFICDAVGFPNSCQLIWQLFTFW